MVGQRARAGAVAGGSQDGIGQRLEWVDRQAYGRGQSCCQTEAVVALVTILSNVIPPPSRAPVNQPITLPNHLTHPTSAILSNTACISPSQTNPLHIPVHIHLSQSKLLAINARSARSVCVTLYEEMQSPERRMHTRYPQQKTLSISHHFICSSSPCIRSPICQ